MPSLIGWMVAAISSYVSPIATPPAEVANIRLDDLVRFSDVIVLGEVEKVERIARDHVVTKTGAGTGDHLPDVVPIALIHVSRVVKGPAGLETVQYVAAPTWTCDITTAVLGETALLFLGDSSHDELLGEKLRRDVRAALPTGDLMDLMWSGRGRMPLAEGRVTYWDDVVMPKDCPFVESPERESFIHSVSVDWLSERIARIETEQRGKPWIHASVIDAGAGKHSWDLEVARDRMARLTVHAHDGDRERRFIASWQTIMEVDGERDTAEWNGGPGTIGSRRDPLGERRFETIGESKNSNVRILAVDSDWMSDPTRFVETIHWLRAWKGIMELVDDPECADHRVSDRQWVPEEHQFRRFPSRQAIWLTVIGGTLLGLVIAHSARKLLPKKRTEVVTWSP